MGEKQCKARVSETHSPGRNINEILGLDREILLSLPLFPNVGDVQNKGFSRSAFCAGTNKAHSLFVSVVSKTSGAHDGAAHGPGLACGHLLRTRIFNLAREINPTATDGFVERLDAHDHG